MSNAEPDLQAYAARSALRHLHAHLHDGADRMLTTCSWLVGEFGDAAALSPGESGSAPDGSAGGGGGLLEGEELFAPEGGAPAAAVSCLEALAAPERSAQVQAPQCCFHGQHQQEQGGTVHGITDLEPFCQFAFSSACTACLVMHL